MELKNAVSKEDISAWVPFKHGFEIHIKYMPKKDLEEMSKGCQRKSYINHQPVMETDEGLFRKKIADELILDWRGLTGAVLKKMFALVDVEDDEVCPCDDANKMYIIDNAYDFDNFVIDSITNIELFKE